MARLKRTSRGSYILPNNERITIKEQKALRSAVVSANRKRKRMIERLPKRAKEKYKDFGVESDFIMRKKSTKLSRFRNKGEFKRYLKSVKKIASGEFERKRVETYRQNYIRALKNTFNSTANKAISAVKKLTYIEFKNKVENEELEEIGYVYYDPQNEKIQRINRQLGV